MTSDYFECKFYFLLYKNGISKITNFLDINSDNVKIYQNLLLKNKLKFMINQKEITMLIIKKLELKLQC